MPAVITTKPNPWRHHALTTARLAGTGAILTLHLALAAVVLTIRTAYALLGVLARAAAYTELYLATRTHRPALGQAAGASIAKALANEFRTAYQQTTR